MKTILIALLVSIMATITIKDCNLKYSNFLKVRETTCPNNWFSADDNLFGIGASYGTYGTDCNVNI